MSSEVYVAPEINMSVAEVFERSDAYFELMASAGDTFLTLLFAYLAASYLVAQSLSALQLVLANIIYIIWQLRLVAMQWSASEAAFSWGLEIQGTAAAFGDAQQYLNEFTALVNLGCILLSIIFMLSCRKKGRLADRLE